MMRKDPPFDMEYIYTTYLLERAEADGVRVVNSPRSLRDCIEKLFATTFPQCCPPLVVYWLSAPCADIETPRKPLKTLEISKAFQSF